MNTDADVIVQLAAAGADLSASHTILNYIYVANRGSADSIASELKQLGFPHRTTFWRGRRKLLLAIHEVIVSEALMRSTRRSVEALIAKFGGGQYDGWEAEVRPQRHSALPLEHSETVVPNRPAARRMSLMLAIPGRFLEDRFEKDRFRCGGTRAERQRGERD